MLVGIVWQAWWLGRAAALLSVLLAVCGVLWARGGWTVTSRTAVAAWLAIGVFALHAIEETLTGLPTMLPALFGAPGWGVARFVTFNASWAAVFVGATMALRPGRVLPLLPLLFLAIAGGIANGLAHLVLMLARGAYFPGGGTALPCLLAGGWLLASLRPDHESPAAGPTAPP